MKKPPPKRPAAPVEKKPPPENPTPPEEGKKFITKVIIMLPKQRAQELAEQINTLRKEHSELLNGPLGELLDLIK